MPEQAHKTGLLVSIQKTRYNAFTGGDGRDVPAGETIYAWMVEAPDVAPIRIAVPAEMAETLKPQIGRKVELLVNVAARNNRLQYRAAAA